MKGRGIEAAVCPCYMSPQTLRGGEGAREPCARGAWRSDRVVPAVTLVLYPPTVLRNSGVRLEAVCALSGPDWTRSSIGASFSTDASVHLVCKRLYM